MNETLYQMAFPTDIIPTDENKINLALSFTLLNSSLNGKLEPTFM